MASAVSFRTWRGRNVSSGIDSKGNWSRSIRLNFLILLIGHHLRLTIQGIPHMRRTQKVLVERLRTKNNIGLRS